MKPRDFFAGMAIMSASILIMSGLMFFVWIVFTIGGN